MSTPIADIPASRCCFTAAQVAEACGGTIVCGPAVVLAQGVSTDTRTLRAGEAFFALRGPRHDGHEYLPQAAAAGAAVFVAEPAHSAWQPPQGAAVVAVQDTARALLALAAWHRRRLRATVAAITGSYGKSTVKAMLGSILSERGLCTVAPASFNNRIGVAKTLLSAGMDDEFVVLEMGTNHPGEIDELARAARPELGIITAIGEVHLEGLGSLDGVKEAKAELIAHLDPGGTLVLNADDPRCASLAERFAGRVRTFGLGPQASLRARRVRRTKEGWSFTAEGQRIRLSTWGRYNVLNAAAAACAARALGISLQEIARGLARFQPPPMRHERLDIGGVRFIRDCYNSNPPAMRAALESFLAEPCAGRKVVVCGDMLELGTEGPRLHRDLGASMARSGVDVLACIGPLGRHVIEGWCAAGGRADRAFSFASAQEARAPLWALLRPGDMVLIKGSRAMQLETLTESTAQKEAA